MQTALATVDATSVTADISSNTTPFWSGVNAIPETLGTRYITINGRKGVGFDQLALGGMVGNDLPHAAMGRMSAGQTTLVGEAGPELVHLPYGSSVLPNHASRYMDKGGGGITFNGGYGRC